MPDAPDPTQKSWDRGFEPRGLPTRARIPGLLAVVLLAAALRVHSGLWDASLFAQFVLSLMGLMYLMPLRTGSPWGARAALFSFVLYAAMLLALPLLRIQVIAPLIVAWMISVFTMGLAAPLGPRGLFPLLLLVPIGVWAASAFALGRRLERLAHLDASHVREIRMLSPDRKRTVELRTPDDIAKVTTLLHEMRTFYPNHEGIADAWDLAIALDDGTTLGIQIGHGNRSRASTWIVHDGVNDYVVMRPYDDVVAWLAPDQERLACSALVKETCTRAARCTGGGQAWVSHGTAGASGSTLVHHISERACVEYYEAQACKGGRDVAPCTAAIASLTCVTTQPYGLPGNALALPDACDGPLPRPR